MHQQANSSKLRSQTMAPQEITTSRNPSISSKTTTILKAETELRKLRRLLTIQKQLHHNHQQYQKITNQIEEFQQTLKRKRKEMIAEKLQQIESRKLIRDFQNQESNETLSKIKEENRRRRQKMESVIQLYKEQYEKVYANKISKRKQQMKFDVEEIRKHQSQYLKQTGRKSSLRVKTEHSETKLPEQSRAPCPKRSPISPTISREDVKLLQIKELVKKRKEYGQQAERLATSIRIPIAMVRRGKNYSLNRRFDDNIDKYQQQKKSLQKPKLNTNLKGNLKALQRKQIGKIATEPSPVKEKLAILENLANGYRVKYDSGKGEALDSISTINLARAQILLNDI